MRNTVWQLFERTTDSSVIKCGAPCAMHDDNGLILLYSYRGNPRG